MRAGNCGVAGNSGVWMDQRSQRDRNDNRTFRRAVMRIMRDALNMFGNPLRGRGGLAALCSESQPTEDRTFFETLLGIGKQKHGVPGLQVHDWQQSIALWQRGFRGELVISELAHSASVTLGQAAYLQKHS